MTPIWKIYLQIAFGISNYNLLENENVAYVVQEGPIKLCRGHEFLIYFVSNFL